jgi:hypothetical protein
MDDIWSGKFFKEVDETNIENLKKEVKTFWENEEISQVHKDLSKELF